MAVNDNWHVHPGRDCCGCTSHPPTTVISPYSAWPFPPSPPVFPPGPPRCPATTSHIPPHSFEVTGLQCKFEPGHDGDHCGYAGIGQGDIFWPQEAPAGTEAGNG